MDEVPLLEVRNLNKVYDNGYHADKDVSFSLPSGLLVGLIGPNGCGKTTMMRCINKMHDITSGDILIDGESVLPKTPAEVARLVSNVPAELTASFGLTVFETVMLGRYPYETSTDTLTKIKDFASETEMGFTCNAATRYVTDDFSGVFMATDKGIFKLSTDGTVTLLTKTIGYSRETHAAPTLVNNEILYMLQHTHPASCMRSM